MATIDEMFKLVQSINLTEIFKDAVLKTSDRLLEMNKNQLLHGDATDDAILGNLKWVEYAEAKADAGSLAPFGVYDFDLFGDFQKAMGITLDGHGNIIIESSDEKNDYLEKLAGGGERVFGLTKDNLDIYASEIILPMMNELVRKHLKLS